jgi:CNT family concentrative nucleoside transporter
MLMFEYLLQYNRYMNLLGILVILGIAFLFSKHKSRVNLRLVLTGILLQLLIGFCVLRTDAGHWVLDKISYYVSELYQFADKGSHFVFGELIHQEGPWGFIFAVKVLPIIIFFGALMAVLFHFNVIQRVVGLINFFIRPLLGTSGAETLCAISNSFLGQTEAPLLIRHYLADMTRSEMLVVMVSGMATISGAILVVYAAMGVPVAHLLASSVMSIPASIVIAKILLPETEKAKTGDGEGLEVTPSVHTENVFDALSAGTSDGLSLALNVGAMLISFLALLALINALLGAIYPALSLQYIFAYLFAPFGYLLGFTGTDALAAGQLIGTKVAVNELIAYGEMVKMNLSERATDILTYALCGFSNFSCIGIQIGGIGALVPSKRQWLTQLGLYAVLGGALSNLMCAMMAGLLL